MPCSWTPAETRYLRQIGADAVGMSSVPEVIVARHAGMKVLGLSAIVNINDPDDFAPILLDEVIKTARQIAPDLRQLIVEVIKAL